jgi:hypothetical protein
MLHGLELCMPTGIAQHFKWKTFVAMAGGSGKHRNLVALLVQPLRPTLRYSFEPTYGRVKPGSVKEEREGGQTFKSSKFKVQGSKFKSSSVPAFQRSHVQGFKSSKVQGSKFQRSHVGYSSAFCLTPSALCLMPYALRLMP